MYKMTTKEEKTQKRGGKMEERKHHQANVEEMRWSLASVVVVPGEFRRPGRRYVTDSCVRVFDVVEERQLGMVVKGERKEGKKGG